MWLLYYYYYYCIIPNTMRRASAVVLLVNPFTPARPSDHGSGIPCSCYNIMKCVYLHVRVCIRIIPWALCSDNPGKWNAIVVMLTKTAVPTCKCRTSTRGHVSAANGVVIFIMCVVIIIILYYVSFQTASSRPLYYHVYYVYIPI